MNTSFRFGNAEMRPATRELLIDGKAATLGARAFDVLRTLIERRDRVVTKGELLDLVWAGLVVEENNLAVQVTTLRKMLGPQCIVTIPGRGYRFVMAVDDAEPGQPTVQAASAASAGSAEAEAAAPRRRGNLPAQLPTLYGRGHDVEQLTTLLESHRVVSIVGAGGIGKTCLAQSLASGLRDRYRHGVWWVELAALSDGRLVAAEVARVLGVPVAGDRTAVEAVSAFLGAGQSLLLLLDNCEHLLDAVAALVDAVAGSAPDVRILTTSQEPLKTAAEHVYRLNSLALPASSGIETARASGSVQLFLGRAQAADPRFALAPDNVDAVVDICRRLDGIPLALELAAARVPLLGAEGLRARLDERFQVLTGGSRFVLRRHQTLRATMDFSHGLLSAEAQVVFRRIGVFAGSFAVDSAQEVAADDGISAWAVLDQLGALIDKSLVIAEGGPYPRLRLLETTRAYALEKLADAGETHLMLERHARSTARMFAQMAEEYWFMADDAWDVRYAADVDNLRAALAWGLRNDAELAIELAGNARALWLEMALQPEGLRYCEQALEGIGPGTSARAAGRLWHTLGAMSANSKPGRSRDAAARAVELLRAADDPATLAAALMLLAMWSKGPPDAQQMAALEELRQVSRPDWSGRLRLLLPNASASVNRAAGRYDEARRDYALGRDLAASAGLTRWELGMQANVADVSLIMGDYDGAVATYREVARRLAPLHDDMFYMFARASLATTLLFRSETAAARAELEAVAPLIARFDTGARYAATAALLAACEERWEAAAQLLGYGEAEAVAHEVDAYDPAESQARAHAMERLSAHVQPDEIERWKRQGASLSVAEAYRVALEAPQTAPHAA